MEELRIFKYKDGVDFNSAFVIAETEEKARAVLEEDTSLDFQLYGSRFLKDVPKAQEHWNETKNPIYLNRIYPF